MMTTCLKLLFVSKEYPPETGWGGIGSYVASIAPALAARGHDVHILSCVADQAPRDYVDQGVHIHRRGQMGIRFASRLNRVLPLPLVDGRVRTGLSAFIEGRRLGIDFDVVEYPEWGAEGWMYAALRTKPTVAHLHTPLAVIREYDEGIVPDRIYRWRSFLERFTVSRADVVTSPSRLLVNTLQNLSWLPNVNVEVIPYPVDWPRWSHVEASQETPPRVLFLGRLEPRKAPELLVKTLPLIKKKVPNAEVLFVGANTKSGNGPSYMDRVMKPLGDLHGCQFVEHVPRHELVRFLSTSRVLAMPSWFESYGLVASEAMSAGRPVVVTSTSGVAELVEGTQAGRVIPPGNPEALAEALLPFLSDSLYAMRMGEKAREVVRGSQDPDKIATRREVVYEQAIAAFKRRRWFS